jgi:hypothetical protein
MAFNALDDPMFDIVKILRIGRRAVLCASFRTEPPQIQFLRNVTCVQIGKDASRRPVGLWRLTE